MYKRGELDTARIHLRVQLAEGRARPAEQTQLQARQQRQGQQPVRHLKRDTGGRAGAPPPHDAASGRIPSPALPRPHFTPTGRTRSPWGSRAAGTPGSRERPAAAGTPPAKGLARPPASPAATSFLWLPPRGPTRSG